MTTKILDNEATPTVFFAASADQGRGSDRALVVWLRRTGDLTSALTVRADIDVGSATAGLDFLGLEAPVTFEPGASRVSVTLDLLDDAIPEPEEIVILELRDAVGGVLGTQSTTVVAISDRD